MNGMITTNENYNLEEILPKLKAYTVGDVVSKVTCSEKYVLEGTGKKVALLDLGAKENNIAKSLNQRGLRSDCIPGPHNCRRDHFISPDGIMLSNGPGDPADRTLLLKKSKIVQYRYSDLCNLPWTSAHGSCQVRYTQVKIRTSRWKSSGQRPSDKSCIYFFSEITVMW